MSIKYLQAKEIEALVSELEQSSNEIEMLHQLIREQSAVSIAKANEIESLQGNLHEIQVKHEETLKKIQNAMERLSKLSARNVNKKLKCRDAMNEKLKDTVKRNEVEIEEKQADLQAQVKSYEDIIDEKNYIITWLNKRLDSALEAKNKTQKLKLYYKGKPMFQKNEGKGHLLSKISELKSRKAELENDVEVLQEHIQGFLKTSMVKTFHNARYSDEIREVYEDLLCWGVGVENVGNVIKTAIEKLTGLDCERPLLCICT